MRYTTLLIDLLSLANATPLAHCNRQASTPDPATVQVESLTYTGSGCPAGTVQSYINSSKTLLTLSFSSILQFGPGFPITESRKTCSLQLRLRYPQNWTFAVETTEFRGYAWIPSGCAARLSAQYGYEGQDAGLPVVIILNGTVDGDFLERGPVEGDGRVGSLCGVERSSVSVNAGQAITCSKEAFLGTEDTKFGMYLHLRWARCGGDGEGV
ncbi:hypothetical protein M011DRAFT_409917 [Sporormia fimetaria CBS 119925]|uniref:Ubiquitin 3 binding protein But2 C-terminal domain-containing protein n=1 Tax=Sporormia fimetaria CBS 119925 TaxID=1340428 RepID=A0A6A6UZN4_9PLEO|nr:hypothetical protein M011DRAFT_409917 [Sporormia fimetaria CBS 119925]